jgi:predicted ribosomally synthesized peptide with nif11-like leader
MSVEKLKKYGQLCETNEEVRAKAKEIGLQDLNGQIAYAKTLGLDIAKEDFEALAKEAGLEKKDELSEEELKQVAGGFVLLSVALVAAVVGSAVGFAGVAGMAVGSAAVKGKSW